MYQNLEVKEKAQHKPSAEKKTCPLNQGKLGYRFETNSGQLCIRYLYFLYGDISSDIARLRLHRLPSLNFNVTGDQIGISTTEVIEMFDRERR